MKQGVYGEFDTDVLAQAQSSGPVHARMKRFFESLFAKYNKSQLLQVSRKVEQVKEVMKVNVTKALDNVEHLEEMEVKAESMENQARLFEKRSGSVLWLMRCRYIKITLIVALVVLAILAYIIYYIYTRVEEVEGPADTPVSEGSSTGPAV